MEEEGEPMKFVMRGGVFRAMNESEEEECDD